MTQLRPNPPTRNIVSIHRMDIALDEGSLPAIAAISDQPQYVQGQASSVSFRPIEARQSNDPVMSLEERGMP
jgi:hypothetical protein